MFIFKKVENSYMSQLDYSPGQSLPVNDLIICMKLLKFQTHCLPRVVCPFFLFDLIIHQGKYTNSYLIKMLFHISIKKQVLGVGWAITCYFSNSLVSKNPCVKATLSLWDLTKANVIIAIIIIIFISHHKSLRHYPLTLLAGLCAG